MTSTPILLPIPNECCWSQGERQFGLCSEPNYGLLRQ
jgi:hypothetical protein